MRFICLLSGFLLLAVTLEGASPFEGGTKPDPDRKINTILREGWKKADLAPPETASDAVFLRRVYLIVAGRSPSIAEARRFLRDKSKDKREKLIDTLLDSDSYGDLLAMRFADMLRIKSEFPINLWPNGVQAWHHQIRAELLADRSYRDMARDMLTASGSNFRVPHANFFRASADRSLQKARLSSAALRPIAARSDGSACIRSTASRNASGLSPSQRKPFSPCLTYSTVPRFRAAATGTPHAIASSAAIPSPSRSDGKRNRSAPCRSTSRSLRNPRNATCSSRPYSLAFASSAGRCGPSPQTT